MFKFNLTRVGGRGRLPVAITKMVIDSLKPRETAIVDLSRALCEVDGVEEVEITVTEVDVKTETVKIVVRGPNIDYDEIARVVGEYGATIRSVDEITVSKAQHM